MIDAVSPNCRIRSRHLSLYFAPPMDTREPFSPTRCVLIVPSRGLTRWQSDVLARLQNTLSVQVVGVVQVSRPAGSGASRAPLFRLFDALTGAPRPRRDRLPRALQSPELRRTDSIADHSGQALPPEDRTWIAARSPDFVLCFDTPPNPTHPPLAPAGTWVFATGTPPGLHTPPPGVHALAAHCRRLGLALQRVADSATAATTLALGHTPVVPYSRKRTLARNHEIAADLLAQAVRDLRTGQARPPDPPASAVVRENASLWARFWVALARESLLRWRDKLFYRQVWDIGLIDGDNLRPDRGVVARARWLTNPGGVFHADPCFMPGDRNRILVEQYPHSLGRGLIAVMSRPAADNADWDTRPVLETAGHLSFPRVYRHRQQCWLVPEMADAGVQHAYALDDAGQLVNRTPVTIDGLGGIDPVLFEHGGHHWAFASPPGRRANYQLELFMADDLFGPYRPHPANPVRIDPRGGRSAGPVVLRGNRLYRFGQVFGRLYGSAIEVFEITTLDPARYTEIPVGRIEIGDDENQGVHSIDFADGLTVIDRFRLEPRWQALWKNGRR